MKIQMNQTLSNVFEGITLGDVLTTRDGTEVQLVKFLDHNTFPYEFKVIKTDPDAPDIHKIYDVYGRVSKLRLSDFDIVEKEVTNLDYTKFFEELGAP